MSFAAKYPGRCGVCDEAIRPDDLCTYVDDEIAHVDCPAPVALPAPCPRCWTVPAANGECACT